MRDLMRYDLLTQDALRGVVKAAIARIAADGLPGAHHFFISFATGHPGVEMSDALRASYPSEMTIVLQHQYWDLRAGDEHFEVSLSFNKMPEHLVIPYAAIRSFVDPSVKFSLQFETDAPAEPQAPASLPAREPAAAAPADKENKDTPDEGEQTGDVVSLDAFRKK